VKAIRAPSRSRGGAVASRPACLRRRGSPCAVAGRIAGWLDCPGQVRVRSGPDPDL